MWEHKIQWCNHIITTSILNAYVKHSVTLCVCVCVYVNLILTKILWNRSYYHITFFTPLSLLLLLYRLSDDVKKILKRKLIVGVRNYKQSHFPSEISSWLWPSVWSYSNNKPATSSLMRGEAVRKRFPWKTSLISTTFISGSVLSHVSLMVPEL